MSASKKGTLILALYNGSIIAEGKVTKSVTMNQLSNLTHYHCPELEGKTKTEAISILRIGNKISVMPMTLDLNGE